MKMLTVIKTAMTTIALLSLFLIGAVASFAASYSLAPWEYDPNSTGGTVSYVANDGSLHLEKNVSTSTNAAAGAAIVGVSGLSTTGLTLSYDVESYCGAGAPRFNVYLSNGQTIFLGCMHGDDGTGHIAFTSGNTYGGVLFPTGETVTGIDIVQDEQGQTTLSSISVNGMQVTVTPKTLQDQCKNGGWKDFSNPSFKNQGACISYFKH